MLLGPPLTRLANQARGELWENSIPVLEGHEPTRFRATYCISTINFYCMLYHSGLARIYEKIGHYGVRKQLGARENYRVATKKQSRNMDHRASW